ncbi:Spermidine/putrescine import ABC transporter permease component PotB [Candidatus Phytoplasma rubi]|uniref:Spermidine/putrescine import ABC transporter permease component PotB n=1 Tax=Candidatus Phytoplasma rubi TaxID=399025 RepID=A0ABY7BTG6_9MOLU|nr:ABC transporter permease [Candidatus Phytoplasma rubi]WAN63275.1 Spermidine/putrescine import ABC transporter permease component PotB [Candidatus Phytoplasma rubi]
MLSRIQNKKENKFYKFLYLPYFIILILFILIPIFIIFLYSIQESNKNSLFNISFTLKYYKDFYTTKVFIYVLFRSILIAIISTFFILLITYSLAYIISKYSTPIQSILILLINGTIWINMILKIQSLMQIFFLIRKILGINLLETNSAMLIGFVYLFLPYMFLPIFLSISKIDHNLINSAKDLGANEVQIFKKIIFPLSLPGLTTGVILVSLQIATNLVVPKYLGPTTITVISELIENKIFLIGDIKSACAIAINLTFLMLYILTFYKQNQFEKKNKSNV